ncbi:MAG: crotonase/enoyl-CoA hydratase family protein [Acidimicrobiales bacterium]
MTTADTTPSVIEIEHDSHVATLWLDRPEKRNAMGMPFFDQLPKVMAGLGRDRNVRAVVIAARGPAFSVGLDLTALAGVAADGEHGGGRSHASMASATHANVLRLQESISSVAECPKPVIAAIHGWCIGGGVDLTAACDIRLAAADAKFSVRETRMAMVADLGSLQRLPLVMPMGYVAELAYTGKDIDAARAERIGFVNAVFTDQAATVAAALEMGTEIAANSPLAVQGTKQVLFEAHRDAVAAGLRYIATWNAGQLRSDDLNEAVTAFFERREPKFTGD